MVAEKIRDYQKTYITGITFIAYILLIFCYPRTINSEAGIFIVDIEDIKLSNKMLVLMEILKQCRIENDKVLVFSKSLPTLGRLHGFNI